MLTLALAGGGLHADDTNAVTLEFRGMVTEGGHELFSLYNPAEARSHWLQLDERIAGHRLVSFDREHLALHLKAGDRPITLVLRGGRIFVDTPHVVAPASPVVTTSAEEGGDQTFEVARLEREQADLAERRALRETFGTQPSQAAASSR